MRIPPRMEIPAFLSHLPVYNGYPVLFIAARVNGKHDFAVMDVRKIQRCSFETLCGVCGKKLTLLRDAAERAGLGQPGCWFIGGPLSMKSRLFTDPAMHEACALFALKHCPHLSQSKGKYRPDWVVDNSECPITINRIEAMAPKSKMFGLARSYGYVPRIVPNVGECIQSLEWQEPPRWVRDGGPINPTAFEIDEAAKEAMEQMR
jgi:hypothetical protein